MDIVKENEKMISVQFNSILEIIEGECISRNTWNRMKYEMIINKKETPYSWYGKYGSTRKVIEASLLGDKELYENELLPKINQLSLSCPVNDYEQKIKVVKRKREYREQGDELDIHKVYQGNMDKAWTKTKRTEVAQKFHLVTLLIEYSGLGDVNASDTLWRSAVAVKIYEELIRAGKSVQVLVSSVSKYNFSGDNRLLTTCLPVKRYNEPLSRERLSVMSNIIFFRSFGFLCKLSQDVQMKNNMGHTCNLNETMPIHIQEEIDMGHTRVVMIGKVCNLRQAIAGVEKCYSQMEDFL